MSRDTTCPYCGVETGGGSHYHCPRCGGVCSMMGHFVMTGRAPNGNGIWKPTCKRRYTALAKAVRSGATVPA